MFKSAAVLRRRAHFVQRLAKKTIFETKQHVRFLCEPALQSQQDNIQWQMDRASTSDGVLEVFDSYQQDFQKHHYTNSIKALTRILFDQLVDNSSWSYKNQANLQLIQTTANAECREVFHPVVHCDQFKQLTNKLTEFMPGLTDMELLHVTLGLLKLQTPLSNDVISRGLMECLHRLHEMSLEQLVVLSLLSKCLRRSGFYINSFIARRVAQRLSEEGSDEMTANEFGTVAVLMCDNAYFMTTDFLTAIEPVCFANLERMSRTGLLKPDLVMDLFEVFGRFLSSLSGDLSAFFAQYVCAQMDRLSLYQLSRFAVYARQCKLFHAHRDLRTVIAARGDFFLDGDLHPRTAADVSCLVALFDAVDDVTDRRERLEQLISDNLDNMDVLVLKHISQGNFLCNSANVDLMQRFMERVHSKMADMIEFISCFISVINMLSRSKIRHDRYDREFVKVVTNLVLDRHIGRQPNHLAAFARFVFARTQNEFAAELPAVFAEYLMSMLPQFSVFDLINVSGSLGASGNKWAQRRNRVSTRLSRQKDYLLVNFSLQAVKRLNSVKSISTLNMLVNNTLRRLPQSRHDVFSEELGAAYDRLAKDISPFNLNFTASVLNDFKMDLASCVDAIFSVLIHRHDRVDLASFRQALDYLVAVNFTSDERYDNPETSRFIERAAMAVLEREDPDMNNVANVVPLALFLAELGVFPARFLEALFDCNFLLKFDAFQKAKQYQAVSRSLQRDLMELNRHVVLSCPELNVPWFHAHYCRDKQRQLSDLLPIQPLKHSIHNALLDVVDGEDDLVTVSSFSPYYHFIDFELGLNSNNDLVSVSNPDCQERVAILVSTPTHYCTKRSVLLGFFQTKIKQLEILGYRVVTIPHFEFNSMELTDAGSRTDYIRRKILTKLNGHAVALADKQQNSEWN